MGAVHRSEIFPFMSVQGQKHALPHCKTDDCFAPGKQTSGFLFTIVTVKDEELGPRFIERPLDQICSSPVLNFLRDFHRMGEVFDYLSTFFWFASHYTAPGWRVNAKEAQGVLGLSWNKHRFVVLSLVGVCGSDAA